MMMGIFLLFATFPSQAFTFISSGVTGWSNATISFNIDTTCNNHLTAVNSALQMAYSIWNNVPSSSLTLQTGSTVTFSGTLSQYVGPSATLTAPAGNPTIICSSNFSSDTGNAANSGIPGLAGAFKIASTTRRIQGGLLVLNVQSGDSANISTLNSTVVGVIVAHEIGHILGLGHTSDISSLMYYDASFKTVVNLSQDDIDGVTFLYPRQEGGSQKLFGCATIENKTDGSRSDGLMVECLMLLIMFWWMTKGKRVLWQKP